MDTVLVTGGTGHLGSAVVALLKPRYQVRILARTRGSDPGIEWSTGDLATGEGLTDAVHAVDIIVHAATYSPAARRGYPLPRDLRHSPPDVDVDGTTRLLDAAAQAGVRHFLHVSITGVDQPRGAYLRLKHSAEELVTTGNVPWSILRSTQFHWLLDRMFGQAARLPAVPLPSGIRAKPVDAHDFAEYVVQCVDEGPGGRKEDFGGPETLTIHELFQQWQRIRERTSRVLPFPVPGNARRAAEHLLCADGRHGTTTWSDWLRANPAQ